MEEFRGRMREEGSGSRPLLELVAERGQHEDEEEVEKPEGSFTLSLHGPPPPGWCILLASFCFPMLKLRATPCLVFPSFASCP